MRSGVASLTRGSLFRTRDTVDRPTPANSAISSSVTAIRSRRPRERWERSHNFLGSDPKIMKDRSLCQGDSSRPDGSDPMVFSGDGGPGQPGPPYLTSGRPAHWNARNSAIDHQLPELVWSVTLM